MFDSAGISDYQMLGEPIESSTFGTGRHQQVAQGLHEILTILNSNRTLDDVLGYIVAQASRLFESSAGVIYRLDPKDSCLRVRASHGLAAQIPASDLSVEGGPIAEAVLNGKPVAVPDTSDPIFPGYIGNQPSRPSVATGSSSLLPDRYRAFVSVPIFIKDQVYGAITLYYDQPHCLSAEELEWAKVLCDQTALAIENARLADAIQGKAVLEERQRIARDLHDSVTQALYGISLYAEAATRLLASGDVDRAKAHLSVMQNSALETLQEMRVLIFELRPPVLEQEGLVAALQGRLDAVEDRGNMETTLVVEGVRQLPATVEQALYRIAQEALNNILKHAHAARTTVLLRQHTCNVTLEIRDEGVGFDVALAREGGGFGLRGIEERVTQLGGQLTVLSTPGAGTVVRVELTL